MDERIRLQVNKMIVHKRIHEYLKNHMTTHPPKVELKEQEGAPSDAHNRSQVEPEDGEVKE